MKKITLLFSALITLIIFESCSGDDTMIEFNDPSNILEEELTYLHNDNIKKWKLTKYYSAYRDDQLDTDLTNCFQDDTYIFLADNTASNTEFGNNSCYANYPEVSDEISSAVYSYYPDAQSLYLDFTRGYYSSQDNTTSLTLIILKCILLTPEKMIFTNGVENSGIGLVFEKVG